MFVCMYCVVVHHATPLFVKQAIPPFFASGAQIVKCKVCFSFYAI